MMVVTTTGYIVSVMGPYAEKSNASILDHIVAENVKGIPWEVEGGRRSSSRSGIRRFHRHTYGLCKNLIAKYIDVLYNVLFCPLQKYVVIHFKDLGVQTQIPSFLNKKEKQFDTDTVTTAGMSRRSQ